MKITYCGVATKHSKSNFTNSLGDPLPDESVVFFNVEGSPYLHEIIDGNLVDTKLTENEIGRWLFNNTIQYQWKYMDTRSKPKPVLPSTEVAFTEAYNNCEYPTNIYGWDGEIPAPGFYTQGGSHIQIFETPENEVIGVAV